MRLLVTMLLICLSSLAFSNNIAVVVRAGGNVIKTDTNNSVVPIKRRDTLIEGDRIKTGNDAYVTLKFADQSVIDLGANTELAITLYQPNAKAGEKRILLELLSGQVRTITGALAKDPGAFDLRTAHASIGVRGTEFEVMIVSATETQVQWHAGVVLVRNVELMGQVVELTESAQAASIKTSLPPVIIDAMTKPGLKKLSANLLELINEISIAPLPVVPIIPAIAVPSVVPIFSDGDTPTTGLGAESQEPIEAFVSLVNSGHWQQARLLAEELKIRFEGLPRFDLYHGILLMAESEFDEAIFSFERVLIFIPDQHRARLELGNAYYLTANYSRARDALQQILAVEPPSDVRRKVNTLLARIDEAERRAQTQFLFSGSAVGGWDSNGK